MSPLPPPAYMVNMNMAGVTSALFRPARVFRLNEQISAKELLILVKFSLSIHSVSTKPVSYLRFTNLHKNTTAVRTDSGSCEGSK